MKFRSIADCASSELEHLIFERGDRYLGLPSVSAIQILKKARSDSTDMYQANPSNASSVLLLIDALPNIMVSFEQEEEIRPGRKVYQARLEEGEPPREYLYRVFADVDRRPIEIVTAYRTSKIDKYWRPER